VIATPGRLLDHLRNQQARLASLRTLVLDEADQMFDMGFFPDLKRIISFLPAKRQTLMFSATMPPDVGRLARTILKDPATVAVSAPGLAAEGVSHTAYPVPTHRKTALLQHLLEQLEMPSVLVFTRTKRGARRLTRALDAAGHGVAELHADRTPAQRAHAMRGFRAGAFPVLVATNIAARGIDVHHITHVVNFDVPNVPEEYVHRIGRTGRAERKGEAFVFVAPDEADLLTRIERQLGQRIPRRRLDDFDYAAAAPPAAGRSSRKAAVLPRARAKPSRGQGRR
jgi:ATP-dependent RNA helicase RhlE